eukprot:Nitzschia sp. Nitz4//scaffold2_size372955//50269//51997//NITZ4_000368-RA/size372955-snap-gene-0.6-mRNA-1//1//CDS//3329546611//333//frame0
MTPAGGSVGDGVAPQATTKDVSVGSVSTAKSNVKAASGASAVKKDKSNLSVGLQYDTPQQKQRLDKCAWPDRLLYASRMILGGNNVNGFLRGTATAQRIKKQRARQVSLNKKNTTTPASKDASDADKKDKKSFSQDEEEKLKLDIMNPRTVKKLKAELEASRHFCVQMHNLLRGVIFDVDHRQSPYLPPHLVIPDENSAKGTSKPTPVAPVVSAAHQPAPVPGDSSNMPWMVKQKSSDGLSSLSTAAGPPGGTTSPGNPEGSTLRKLRKKKLPPDAEPPINLPEFDNGGRRLCTKKDHNNRLFEVLRFRALRQGDFVAARTTSRDLWILAKVLKNYPGVDMAPLEFLQLSGTRRDAVFKGKVLVQDVEDKDGNNSAQVARSLVLPLPRTYSEAADWGSRIKKGMRVYAMYPQTTSLYPATVTDSTTYCRGDDDIIVVQFDGEEIDATGSIPKYHIPARFVTLIPRELPASQAPAAQDPVAPHAAASKNAKRKSASGLGDTSSKQQKRGGGDSMLAFDFDGNFDALDLDFDKPLVGDEDEDPGFLPLL